MTERLVMINVTKEFRNKIKFLKRELTYQQYFDNLLISEGKNPSVKDTKKTNSRKSKIQ